MTQQRAPFFILLIVTRSSDFELIQTCFTQFSFLVHFIVPVPLQLPGEELCSLRSGILGKNSSSTELHLILVCCARFSQWKVDFQCGHASCSSENFLDVLCGPPSSLEGYFRLVRHAHIY